MRSADVPDDFRPPWICWWVADWAGSDRVAQLDAVPRLVLAELFWLEGRAGPFVPDAKSIAKRIRLASEEVALALPLIAGFFEVLPDGRWSNPKAAKERANAYVRSQRASVGAEGRWKGHEGRTDAKRNAVRNARGDARRDAQTDAREHAVSRLTSHVSETHNSEAHASPRERAATAADAAPVAPAPGPAADPPKARKPRAEPQTDHHTLARWWAETWKAERMAEWAFSPKDFAALKALLTLAKGDAAEIQRRGARMLAHHDRWIVENASLTTLRSKWNELGVEVTPTARNGHDHGGRITIRERIARGEVVIKEPMFPL